VPPTIRNHRPADQEAVLALALRAWAPVFASANDVLGPELAVLLHGADWRVHQAAAVREVLGSHHAWVAVDDGTLVGFAAAAVADAGRGIGEVGMVAVEPAAQRSGIGARLTEHAAAWLRAQGMRVVVIGTGGDPGHAPARALYESLGYRPFPVVQYYRAF